MGFGNRLQEARKSAKLSQTEAANRLNKTQPTISGWENEDYSPDLNDILGMCEMYGVSPNQLLGMGGDAELPVEVDTVRGPYLAYSDGEKVRLTSNEEIFLMKCLIRSRDGQSGLVDLVLYAEELAKKR